MRAVFQVTFLFGQMTLCVFVPMRAVYIRFKTEPENTTVYQGHMAILHCQATGDPEPHIHWTVKDKALDLNRNRR